MINEYIDIVLFIALCVDLLIKNHKYNKVKKMMPHYQRYQYNNTKLRNVLYAIIIALSLIYLGYRLYGIATGHPWQFPQIFILIPAIDYYVIWDYAFRGIYFNSKGIFYKSEYYEFRRAVHIYRDLVKDHYEYELIYRQKEGGLRNVYIRVPNEKEAFPLLATIPFEEE